MGIWQEQARNGGGGIIYGARAFSRGAAVRKKKMAAQRAAEEEQGGRWLPACRTGGIGLGIGGDHVALLVVEGRGAAGDDGAAVAGVYGERLLAVDGDLVVVVVLDPVAFHQHLALAVGGALIVARRPDLANTCLAGEVGDNSAGRRLAHARIPLE